MLEPHKQHCESESLPAQPAGDQVLTVAQAIANLNHADLSLRYYAAWWLGKFGTSTDVQTKAAVVEALIAALDDQSDQTELGGYPLRRNAARALGKLADLRAVPPLIRCLESSDFYVREAAAQSLGMLGDSAAVPALTQMLAGGVAAAQPVAGRPHMTQPYKAVLEALGLLKATAAIPFIQPLLDHPTQRLQNAAARAMYVLTQESVYGERLVAALDQSDLKWRRAVLLDLGASGYLPAAEAIAQAAVENSFKLISLKGLLEGSFQQSSAIPVSADAQRVMTLMDSLL